MLVINILVIALYELLDERRGSLLVLATNLFSYCKKVSGFISSVPAPPTGVALHMFVLSYTQSFWVVHSHLVQELENRYLPSLDT